MGHQFQPHGATCLLLLRESHFSAHTSVDRRCTTAVRYCSGNAEVLKTLLKARTAR